MPSMGEVYGYVYGPAETSVEQINNSTGTVLYLHHDQAGSTRLLTSSTGAKEASFTCDAYGNTTGRRAPREPHSGTTANTHRRTPA